MAKNEINIKAPLITCLTNFSGAEGYTLSARKKSLEEPFKNLAQKLIYGGYIRVRDDYAIFISKVEFYYHEEEETSSERIKDDIVYHRNGRFLGDRSVPYFPIMTLHSHWSGFDITFENEALHYRASALIRKYVVLDLKSKMFIKLDTSPENINKNKDKKIKIVGKIVESPDPLMDDRSTYLQYFLNGFSMGGIDSGVRWQDLPIEEHEYNPEPESRKNAQEHRWGYSYIDKAKYLEALQRRKEIL